jgi:hypothetical protein
MFSKALLIFSLISVAFASLAITDPVASTTYSGGQLATIAWHDDGDGNTTYSPAAFGPSNISIYAGNALQQTSLQLISSGLDVSTASSVNFTVDPTSGPNSPHYFIRIESLNGKSGTVPLESFSAQFTLINMTGVFSPTVLSEISGQSTAPIASASPTATGASSLTTSLPSSTHSSSTPSATGTSKASSGAISIKAGWAGLVFGAIVGATMF